jgi:subtilisin family serine protease
MAMSRRLLFALSLASLPLAASPAALAQAPFSPRTSPELRGLAGLSRLRAPVSAIASLTTGVVLELDRRPDEASLRALEQRGARFDRDQRGLADGFLLASGRRLLAARIPLQLTAELERLPGLVRIHADARPMEFPRPLVQTTETIGASAVWGKRDALGAELDGQGLTVCDIDSGIDVLHPMFFRDDGGGFDFVDIDGDGGLTPGVDTVDLGAGPVVVRHLNGVVSSYWDDAPRFGTGAESYDPRYDYLYADENGSGAREAGASAGFFEATPSYGERLFVPDDADGNGRLDVGERLIALGSSKIKAFRIDNEVYTRGVNLIEAPLDEAMSHGTGAASVIAGGQLGRSGLVGVAPGAELVMATDTRGDREVAMAQFCIQQGARVVLHEYAPWVGYHLDGSSPMEQLIDTSSAQGVVHVNPAGNLSTSKKLYKRTIPAGQVTDIRLDVPEIGIRFVYFTLLWRDASRELEATLLGPGGIEQPIPLVSEGGEVAWDPDTTLFAYRADSSRGTAMATTYLFSKTGETLVPPGEYTIRVTEPSDPAEGPLELIAYVADEVSGWGQGAQFPEFSSEEHLVGYPGTADHGMAISAFTGNDYDGATPGERAYYSGRGHRIDGTPLLWISGPDNPIAAGSFDAWDLGYIVYGGTSGASPHVAGASALLLQNDSTLDGEGVKAKIREGAIVDSATGQVPNDDFGWGKLEVYRSLYGSARPAGSAPSIVTREVAIAAGPQTIQLELADPDEPPSSLRVELDRDYDGVFEETLAGAELSVDYAEPGMERVRMRVVDSTGRVGGAVLRIEVEAPELPYVDPWDGLSLAGGGICSVTAPGERREGLGVAGVALGLAALAGARRLRRRELRARRS